MFMLQSETYRFIFDIVWFLIFLTTAFFYSSSGMGGASAYLAYLSIMGIPHKLIPSSALSLSVFSSAISTFNWIRAGYFRKLNILIVVFSSPFAFLGGLMRISEKTFNIIISLVLISAGILMLARDTRKVVVGEESIKREEEKGTETKETGENSGKQINDKLRNEINEHKKTKSYFISDLKEEIKKVGLKKIFILLPFSSALGFFGGLIGIGCGVFLFPLVYYLGIMNEKESATAGAFFIFINSVSGLIGHIAKSSIDFPLIMKFLIPVIIGAFLGSRISSTRFPQIMVRRIFSSVVISIGVIKIFF